MADDESPVDRRNYWLNQGFFNERRTVVVDLIDRSDDRSTKNDRYSIISTMRSIIIDQAIDLPRIDQSEHIL